MNKEKYLIADNKIAIYIVACFLIFSGQAFAFNQYTITDLGDLGADISYPFDINDRGDVVGFSKSSEDGRFHAFYWSNGQLMDLGPGAATSLNNHRVIVGRRDIEGDYVQWRPSVSGFQKTILGFVSTGYDGSSYNGQNIKINEAGEIAGIDQNQGHFFLPSMGSSPVWMNAWPGCTPGYKIDINNRGDLLFLSGYGGPSHIYHSMTGQFELLGDGSDAEMVAINDAGEAVGRNSGTSYFGFFSKNTGFMVPNTYNYLWDINNAGIAVGGGFYADYAVLGYESGTVNMSATDKATIYSSADNNYAFLIDLLANQGSWTALRIATAINNAGQIVGIGINNGKKHAFLLTPVQ